MAWPEREPAAKCVGGIPERQGGRPRRSQFGGPLLSSGWVVPADPGDLTHRGAAAGGRFGCDPEFDPVLLLLPLGMAARVAICVFERGANTGCLAADAAPSPRAKDEQDREQNGEGSRLHGTRRIDCLPRQIKFLLSKMRK